jgi:uncharacterized surface protein with fasciclin (FAS1) repeats
MNTTRAATAADLKSNAAPTSAEPSSGTSQAVAGERSQYRAETPRTEKNRAAKNRPEYQRAEKNIIETAAIAGSFKTLGTAIRAAGLLDMLSGKGPFTVFAPTDEAFAKLPKADLEALLRDKARLTQVLTFHIVSDIVKAPKESSPRSATTVNGTDLKITAKDRGFRVNDAAVVKTEILASNGVIHAIDTVLMPR